MASKISTQIYINIKQLLFIGFLAVKNMFFSVTHILKNSTKTISQDLPITIVNLIAAPECIGIGSRESNSYALD